MTSFVWYGIAQNYAVLRTSGHESPGIHDRSQLIAGCKSEHHIGCVLTCIWVATHICVPGEKSHQQTTRLVSLEFVWSGQVTSPPGPSCVLLSHVSKLELTTGGNSQYSCAEFQRL